MTSKVLKSGKVLRELRIHLCPVSKSSQGVRDFINEHYVNIKKQIPTTPILVREARDIDAKLWARYEFGREQSFALNNQNSKSILEQVVQLIGK